MTKVDLSSVYKVTAKGRTYYYAWRPGRGEGKAARLHEEPGTDAFVEELAEKLKGRKAGDMSKLGGLVTAYKGSDAWLKDIGDKTRANWGPWLDKIREKFGETSLAAFDRPKMRVAIRKWRDRWKSTPRAADMGVQAFSRLLSFGVEEGELAGNICEGIPRLYRNDRSMIIWTDEDLAELAKVASKEVMWAARLAGLTGLRQADLLRLSWSHIQKLSIEIRTGKSGGKKTAVVPIYAELRELLAEIPKRSTTVLTTTKGLPWKTGFGSSWQDDIQKTDIDKHFHDLRGTFATKAYVAGLTIREIAEILTWSEDDVEALINKYVKKDELLRARIAKMDRARTRPAKPSAKPT